MAASTDVSCKAFTNFLIAYEPHYDKKLISDVTPVDGWVNHVATGTWDPFSGINRIQHRIRRMFPDLSGCWQPIENQSCVGTPCDPELKLVGYGVDQTSYGLNQIGYATDLFCFEQLMTYDRAKDQFADIIKGLRQATVWIWSHHFRTEALKIAKRKVLAGSGMQAATWTESGDCTTLTLNALPTSKLTIQFLQRFVQPLIGEGYFGENNPLPDKNLFELVTDVITSNNLLENNPAISDFLRVSKPEEFGRLFQYGITRQIGNFGIRHDPWPLRYQIVSGTTLNLVLPYTNNPATLGIGADYNEYYELARIQVDFIWNRMAMRSLVRRSAPINPQMPFAPIDYGGRWQFVMDNLTCRDAGGNIIPVDNTFRNKGKFVARFSDAIQPEHPEWAVAIFSLREISCLTDATPCQTAYPYVSQRYESANDPCPNPDIEFSVCALGDGEVYTVNEILCNGVPIDGPPGESIDNIGALVTWLNTNAGSIGTWANPEGTTITLSGSTCSTVDLDVTCAAE